jgi:hypothetical protein
VTGEEVVNVSNAQTAVEIDLTVTTGVLVEAKIVDQTETLGGIGTPDQTDLEHTIPATLRGTETAIKDKNDAVGKEAEPLTIVLATETKATTKNLIMEVTKDRTVKRLITLDTREDKIEDKSEKSTRTRMSQSENHEKIRKTRSLPLERREEEILVGEVEE